MKQIRDIILIFTRTKHYFDDSYKGYELLSKSVHCTTEEYLTGIHEFTL